MPKRENKVTTRDLMYLLMYLSNEREEPAHRRAMQDGARATQGCLVLCRTHQEGVMTGVRPENVVPLDRLERLMQSGRRQPLLVDNGMMVDLLEYALHRIRRLEGRLEQIAQNYGIKEAVDG